MKYWLLTITMIIFSMLFVFHLKEGNHYGCAFLFTMFCCSFALLTKSIKEQ